MTLILQPGRLDGSAGNVPNIANLPGGSMTANKGRVITRTAAVAVLHGLGGTVTNVLGVTLEGVTSGTSDGPATNVNYAKVDRNTQFISGIAVGGAVLLQGGVAVSTVLTVGDDYGLLTISGQDYIDSDDESDVLVELLQVDNILKIAWFKFLESTLQEP